jgi:hypothetical protein
MGRPEHIQKYLNDQEYREYVAEKSRANNIDKEAKRQALATFYKQNVNNYAQKHALLNWILRNKWTRRLFWETHEPLAAEDEKTPALCASCEGVYSSLTAIIVSVTRTGKRPCHWATEGTCLIVVPDSGSQTGQTTLHLLLRRDHGTHHARSSLDFPDQEFCHIRFSLIVYLVR